MHKRLLILGFLLTGPLSGYDLHRRIAAHGELYKDLKKPNLYYLLDRMAQEGLVRMRVEPGARGPRGERLLYSITSAGRSAMVQLLRSVLLSYEPVHSGIDVAIVLLDQLPAEEARGLLQQRLDTATGRRRQLAEELGPQGTKPGSAGEHMLMLVDAEIQWLRTALQARSARAPIHR